MAKRDHAAELKRWKRDRRFDLGPTLRSLPPDIDPKLVLPHVLASLDSAYRLGKTFRRLPPSVIRGVLAATHDHRNHLFVRLAVVDEGDDKALAASWERAVQTLVDLDLTYAWRSKPRRDRIRKVARNADLVEAVQGTVAHSKHVSLDMLAVLVADGSDASFDALVPHLDPALVHQDVRLERLTQLRIHARRTPALDAMFAEIDRTLAKRRSGSPALAFGPLIGVGEVDVLWFSASIGSTQETYGNVSRIQGHVRIDSRQANWFGVSVADVDGADIEHTIFDADKLQEDELKIGRCKPEEVPAWLARVAAKLKITWDEPYVSSSLRGAKRARIAAWLLGGSPAPARRKR